MSRKILPDIFIAAVIAALAFFLAAGPVPSIPAPPAVRGMPVLEAGVERSKTWIPVTPLDRSLKERNLFAESGEYVAKSPPNVMLPENPYSLVAVLMGKDKKAVFREYTGAIQTLAVGKTLIDGAVLTEIAPRSVKVRKGKDIKELKLFDVRLRTAEAVKQEGGKIGSAQRSGSGR